MVDAFRRALGGLSSRRTLTALEINLGVLGLPLNDEKIGEDVVLSMVYQEDERLRKREDEGSFEASSKFNGVCWSCIC